MSNSITNSGEISRQCIEEALAILVRSKDFQDITITELCNKAGVSRQTYYRNFKSKKELLHNAAIGIMEKITCTMEQCNASSDSYYFWLAIFKGIQPYSETFRLMIKAGLADEILSAINNRLAQFKDVDGKKKYYSRCFWYGAVYNVIREWLVTGEDTTPEEMARIMEHMPIREDNLFPWKKDDIHTP